jgi:hypothetical protein
VVRLPSCDVEEDVGLLLGQRLACGFVGDGGFKVCFWFVGSSGLSVVGLGSIGWVAPLGMWGVSRIGWCAGSDTLNAR